jgi:hypothetical protein
MTRRQFAARYRIGPDRVRAMILRGELKALNVAPTRSRRPRWVILPEHATEWERSRQVAAPTPKPKRSRKRRPPGWVDYFPE